MPPPRELALPKARVTKGGLEVPISCIYIETQAPISSQSKLPRPNSDLGFENASSQRGHGPS